MSKTEKKKEYIFVRTVEVVEETTVMANSYEEAETVYCAGGGVTDEVDSVVYNGDWECIQNPDISKEK